MLSLFYVTYGHPYCYGSVWVSRLGINAQMANLSPEV